MVLPVKARKTIKAAPVKKFFRYILLRNVVSKTFFKFIDTVGVSFDEITILFISSKISFGESRPSMLSTPRNHLKDTTASS